MHAFADSDARDVWMVFQGADAGAQLSCDLLASLEAERQILSLALRTASRFWSCQPFSDPLGPCSDRRFGQ